VGVPLTLREVIWESPVDTAIEGNSLRRASGLGWNAGAISKQLITGGEGYIEFTATEVSTNRVCGFSVANSGTKFQNVDFALLLTDGGALYVYESGLEKASVGGYSSGDRLRIEVSSGAVRYKRNGALLYSSATSPSYPLRADAALHDPEATISDAVISGDVGATRVAAMPLAAPGGGIYTSVQTVNLWSTTPNAAIYYTLDGSDPTESSTPYVVPISIGSESTLRAKAFRTNWAPSPIFSASYVFQQGTLGAPVINPGGGTFPSATQVTIQGPSGALVRYTIDGSVPTNLSPEYVGPITVDSSLTVKARSFGAGWVSSAVTSARFQVGEVDDTPPTITLLEPSNATPIQ
jgi:hypothetical protein